MFFLVQDFVLTHMNTLLTYPLFTVSEIQTL